MIELTKTQTETLLFYISISVESANQYLCSLYPTYSYLQETITNLIK